MTQTRHGNSVSLKVKNDDEASLAASQTYNVALFPLYVLFYHFFFLRQSFEHTIIAAGLQDEFSHKEREKKLTRLFKKAFYSLHDFE